ncbi:MAG: glycosyltransferase [Chitinophagaceae bacterium]|nr:glycosyltransferase [Chitinophagaceae bacterium]
MKSGVKKRWYDTIKQLFQRKGAKVPSPFVADPAAVPLSWEQKEVIKDRYTEGREYFLFVGDIDPKRHQLLVLLKAFSQFKKWQRSDMKLVMAGNNTSRTPAFKRKLANYKYREDVLIFEAPQQPILLQLLASAYAVLYIDKKDIISIDLLNAIQSGVPVIAGKTPLLEKLISNNGIFTALNDPEELARKLLLIYKNEDLRATLINRG